ncbi:UNVERIFIED_CONTAM: hypothetical protein FKN15_051854 [Acipenser sinensis]
MLSELEEFLKILDKENLSSTAIVRKCLLTELLQTYMKSDGCDEEYIYMNKVIISSENQEQLVFERDDHSDSLTNGSLGKHSPAPQKSLPDLPRPRPCSDREPLPAPKLESPEGYYEEAQPYDTATNENGEAVSSSYESYDEEEVTKGKSTTHQWPSTEASIELMKDVRICAFLWRKKWLGQWAKQLCVIRENRLLVDVHERHSIASESGSSTDSHAETPEIKDVKKKYGAGLKLSNFMNIGKKKCSSLESPEKCVDTSGYMNVLVNSQWRTRWCLIKNGQLYFYQDKSKNKAVHQPLSLGGCVVVPDPSPEHLYSFRILHEGEQRATLEVDVHERHSIASESGSSTDSHAETPEIKDGYMNVLVNSQWRTRWCLIKNGQLYFYQDKSKNKAVHQPLSLGGCVVVPDPSPEHLYSFRILHEGEQRATLEAKSSDEMGHWLGLLLSESGSKTDPEELTYDYVDSERISCIVNAAKNSLNLMQRKYSEPNTYTDNLPAIQNDSDDIYDDVDVPEHTAKSSDEMGHWLGLLLSESGSKTDPEELTYDYVDSERISCIVNAAKNSLNLMQRKYSEPNTYTDNLPAIQNDSDDIYDDVDVPEHTQENAVDSWSPEQEMDRVYLDLIPVKSFLHPSPGWPSPGVSPVLGRASCQAPDSEREGDSQPLEGTSKAFQQRTDSELPPARTNIKTQTSTPEMDVDQASPKTTINIQSQHQKIFFPSTDPHRKSTASPQAVRVTSEMPDRPKLPAAGSIETRLGKGRTESEIRRFTDERDRLEREKEQIRNSLALLRKHKKELKEDISSSNDAGRLAALEHMLREMEEDCKQKERHRAEAGRLNHNAKEPGSSALVVLELLTSSHFTDRTESVTTEHHTTLPVTLLHKHV